jgi:hypothetical protein
LGEGGEAGRALREGKGEFPFACAPLITSMTPGKAWAILTAPINQPAIQFFFGIEITLITLDEASCMETAALNPGFLFISIR